MSKPALRTSSTSTLPIQGAQRHGFVDALRGFALLGIILVNVEYILQPAEIGWSNYSSTTDTIVRWLVVAFGQTKIYPLFALLFGYGLALQLSRSAGGHGTLWPRYRRRMTGILLLGIIHGIAFFPGDILVIYALVGALAYRLRDRDSRTLLRYAAVTYLTASALWLLAGIAEVVTGAAATLSVAPDTLNTLLHGSFGEVALVHFASWLGTLAFLLLLQGPAVFAFFLVGMALGRTDLLSNPATHGALAQRWLLYTAPVGLVGAALGASLTLAGGNGETLGFAIGFFVAPLVAASYLAALALTIGARPGRVSGLLESAGRMSLTVYLMESVVLTTLAYGYGFGLLGRLSPLQGVLIAAGVWLSLSLLSDLWMRIFRFGPFEWGLRSFTYRRFQPLRRRPLTSRDDHEIAFRGQGRV
jgi:uncharacterized protein